MEQIFKCDYCGKIFCSKFTLKRHVKNLHPFSHHSYFPQFRGLSPTTTIINATVVLQKSSGEPSPLVCDVCGKSFAKRRNVIRHKREVHKIDIPKKIHLKEKKKLVKTPKRKIIYKCAVCSQIFNNKSSINNHIVEHHNIPIDTEDFTFANHNEFLTWKLSIEKKTASFYVLRNKHTTTEFVIHTYECNCSGEFKSLSKGKRIKKSIKSGAYCPARMLYKVPLENRNINVTFTSTHIGHQCQYRTLKPYKPRKVDKDNHIEENTELQKEEELCSLRAEAKQAVLSVLDILENNPTKEICNLIISTIKTLKNNLQA